jgi:integrase/recombinase XerD
MAKMALARTCEQAVGLRKAETNPAAVYLASLAPSGRRTMAARLTAAAKLMGGEPHTIDWAALRFEHVAALRSRLSELGRAPASVNATLSALRGVARAAWQLGRMTVEDYHRIVGVKNVRGSRLPAGRALTSGEISALLDTCAGDESAAGALDAAIVALLYGAGLRRSEAAGLALSHYDSTAGELKVLGKGDTERLVPLGAGVTAALNDLVGRSRRERRADARSGSQGWQSGNSTDERAGDLRRAPEARESGTHSVALAARSSPHVCEQPSGRER